MVIVFLLWLFSAPVYKPIDIGKNTKNKQARENMTIRSEQFGWDVKYPYHKNLTHHPFNSIHCVSPFSNTYYVCFAMSN